MRLIDANALKEKAFGNRKGLLHTSDVDDAPTVEAIPIEWLMEKSRDLSLDALLIYEGMRRSEKEKATHSGRYKETITKNIETFLAEWHMWQHIASLIGDWKEERKNEQRF